jgi:hypothetical protein
MDTITIKETNMLFQMPRVTGFCLALALFLAGPARAEEGTPGGLGGDPPNASIDEGLQANARKIIDHVKEQGWANVGVLKFRARVGDGEPRDNVGELNLSLPDRLETALILELRPSDVNGNKLRIISKASETAATNQTLNHLTEEGMQAFFKLSPSPFKPAWGKEGETIEPDAFLTGEAVFAPDMKTVTVHVKAFARNQLALKDVCTFTARTTLRTLSEAGFSFASRGGIRRNDPVLHNKEKEEEAQKAAQEVVQASTEDLWQKEAEQTLEDLKTSPVKLTALYNDEPIAVDVNLFRPAAQRDNVGLRIPAPQTNQAVAFRLENTSTDTTYAVVLKINGKNSIFQEEKSALDCYKWILAPGKSVTVRGFQKNFKEHDPFKVLPPEVSERQRIHYGNNAGILQFVLFKQATSEDEVQLFEKTREQEKSLESDTKAQELGIIGRGMEDAAKMVKPFQLKALQGQLRADLLKAQKDGAKGRGMLGAGDDTQNNPVTEEKVKLLPTPVLDVAIRYYKP